MTPSDLSAKLLAQENITVVRSNTKTASFDVSSRVLTIPLWKDMTPEIEDMLQCHEVGHALFTDAEAWMKAFDSFEKKSARTMHGYMNVVEDARIEKLMKRRFPGSRKSFFAAYKLLMQRDFFKLRGKDVNSMLLIDRINLYFKAGIAAGIKFSAEEKVWVDKVDRVETIQEVVELAKQIYDFTKAKAEERKSQTAEDDVSFDQDEDEGEDDFDDSFDDMDSIEDYDFDNVEGDSLDEETEKTEKESKTSAKTDEVKEEDLESETDKNLSQSLEALADETTQYHYFEFGTALSHDPVIPFKQVLAETKIADEYMANDARDGYYNHKKEHDKFMTESERVVNYLVKEFEMRKSAQAYRRAQVSKSGALNMNKIHAYKLTDDIFRRITTIPNGKNHGMVFLLDWSGSMMDVIAPTVKQVINLAMFCRRINIPFEVYAFSGQYMGLWNTAKTELNNNFIRSMSMTCDKDLLFSDGRFNLLNLFSSKMSNLEFNTAARRFSSHYVQRVNGYSLGDTPLNEALCHMLEFIPEFTRRNNIEKMTLVTLTDGQGGGLNYTNKYARSYSYENGKRFTHRNFLRDPKTQKTYDLAAGDSCNQTETLLKMIKDRYEIAVLGFYICKNRRQVLNETFRDNLGRSSKDYEIEEMRAQFRERGFYSMLGTGRDELFIIPDSSTKIVDEELVVDSSASAATIARKLGRQFNNKRQSRVLLDRFIGYVA